MAPRLKKPSAKTPWYGEARAFRIRLYQHGKAGCTLQEAADLEGVSSQTLIELCRKESSFYRAFQKGKSKLAKRTRSMVAELALGEEVRDQDRINALKLLTQLLKLDKKEEVDLDATDGIVSALTWADIATSGERIERELDDGTRSRDPVTDGKPRKRRSARPHQIIDS